MDEFGVGVTPKIQNLLFPSGTLWDKEIGNYRTFDENRALLVIQRISGSYKMKKRKIYKILPLFGTCAREGTRTPTPHGTRS